MPLIKAKWFDFVEFRVYNQRMTKDELIEMLEQAISRQLPFITLRDDGGLLLQSAKGEIFRLTVCDGAKRKTIKKFTERKNTDRE